MLYWVYENWRAEHKAVIHNGSCGYCNNGSGCHPNPRGDRNGKWHGPFESLQLAEAAAKATNQPVKKHDCKAPLKVGRPRKQSLTGLIQTYWGEGGEVQWNWEQLLQHAVAADQELESLGYNPAVAFRRYRLANDTEGMYRYIAGFYAYPFSPNYKNRTSKPNIKSSPERPPLPATIQTLLPHKSSSLQAIELAIELEKLLAEIEPKGSSRDLAEWINKVQKNGKIPPHISLMMHAIRMIRNKVAHEDYPLSPEELSALKAQWEAIKSWWSGRVRE